MPQISISGRSYHYRDVGEGVPVVLLHGFPFTGDSYWPQLERPPTGCRLIVPDHRGFGLSDLAPGIVTMDAMAEDALALLDALSIDAAIIGGVSMGGYVAIALTRLNPGRVKGLVLIDTQSSADDDAGKARRETVAKDVLTNGVGPLAESMLPKLFSATAPAEMKAKVDQMMRAQNPEAVAAASRGMGARVDGKDILPRFAGPLLVIVGSADQITPVEKAKSMAELVPNSELIVIEGAGHLAHLEQPEKTGQLIEQFAARF